MSSKVYIALYVLSLYIGVILSNILKLKTEISKEWKRSHGYQEDTLLNFTELSARYGYNSEEHTVVTEDGYVLTIFRINGRKCTKLKRPPVILMHGLLLSSDVFLDAGPDAGLAYLISNECYDLWVGNHRGNYYSRRHVRLDPDRDPEFWKFSVEEIGFYDIPATIDYVLKSTNEKKINYIGYSQGGTTYLIMCSERPGYCDKANVFIGLAPASLGIRISVALQVLFHVALRFEELLTAINIYEVFQKGSLLEELLLFICRYRWPAKYICGNILEILDTPHPGSIKEETIRKLYAHFPAGVSVRTLAHNGQILLTGHFQKYDYGKRGNLKVYQAVQPPMYNLSAVTVPCVMLYGRKDKMVSVESMLWLIKQLPNVLEVVVVSDPLWNHVDIAFSQFTKKMIFPKIIEYLEKFSIS